MIRRVWIWGPVVVMMAVIYAYSDQSAPEVPFSAPEYFGHFAGYAMLGTTLLRAFAAGRWDRTNIGAAWRALAVGSFYGVTDEYHQSFVPGRTPDPADWFSDTLGVLFAVTFGLCASAVVEAWRRKTRGV